MKFTIRDKVCKLIGKYEEMEQNSLTSAIAAGFATAIGMERSRSAAEAKAKADTYGLFVYDLKKLLEEDTDDIPSNIPFCRCGGEDGHKKEDNKHE